MCRSVVEAEELTHQWMAFQHRDLMWPAENQLCELRSFGLTYFSELARQLRVSAAGCGFRQWPVPFNTGYSVEKATRNFGQGVAHFWEYPLCWNLRAAAPAADPGSKYGGLATFGYLLKQGNSLYQLKKHTQLHPASRRFRGAIFEEAGPLGIGILLVQQVAKCSWSTIRDSGQLRCNT
jgi:hypothetical protein